MHAYLDILAINREQGAADSVPGGMDSRPDIFPQPKDTSFATWMDKPSLGPVLRNYQAWMAEQGRTFSDALAERGIDQLVALDAALAGESGGGDAGTIMVAVADEVLDDHLGIGEGGADQRLQLGCGQPLPGSGCSEFGPQHRRDALQQLCRSPKAVAFRCTHRNLELRLVVHGQEVLSYEHE